MSEQIQIEVRDSLADIPAVQWNALALDGYPFMRHEFLHALESTGCLGDATGWYPRYFMLWIEGNLLGAIATYVKTNSYGEFVFDWAWASAYERHSIDYYPKLICAAPFTPATGPRLLVHPDQSYDDLAPLLAAAARQFADHEGYSGVHWLFLTERDNALLCGVQTSELQQAASEQETSNETGSQPQRTASGKKTGSGSRSETARYRESTAPSPASDHMARIDCQYHWHNAGFTSFDHFLEQCTAKRRKTIRRERRHVSDEGLRVQARKGSDLSTSEWREVHALYASTYDRKWGNPSLSVDFFLTIGQSFGDHVLIVLVHDDTDDTPERAVACSIMFIGEHTLYGRYWGCRRQYNSLHFEACYYQGIEYCIEHGIQNFEPGAQGEHKITRGFEPTLTHSAHYIAHPQFRDAIQGYLDQETRHVEQRCAGLTGLLPFKATIEAS